MNKYLMKHLFKHTWYIIYIVQLIYFSTIPLFSNIKSAYTQQIVLKLLNINFRSSDVYKNCCRIVKIVLRNFFSNLNADYDVKPNHAALEK